MIPDALISLLMFMLSADVSNQIKSTNHMVSGNYHDKAKRIHNIWAQNDKKKAKKTNLQYF